MPLPSRNYSTNTSFEVITELCYEVSPPHHVPSHIKQPPYAISGVPPVVPRSIEIKTDEQIAAMRTACRTARKVLNVARDNVKVRLDFTTVKMVPRRGTSIWKGWKVLIVPYGEWKNGFVRVFSLERSIVGDFVAPFKYWAAKKTNDKR